MKTLVIIGAGPGGYECAVKAAKAGLDVHVFDDEGHVGGTCLCEGCIPTKCLCHSAEVFATVKQAEEYGLKTDTTTFDYAHVIARKEKIVAQMQAGVKTLLQTPGITFHPVRARFAPQDAHTICYGEERLHADAVIIATGSQPKFLPIPGAHLPGVVTSTELLDMKQIPRRLCIIGGGVIGLEFAGIFNTFGSEVTVIEFCKEILPNFDKDIAKRLRTRLKKNGIEFVTGAPVTAIHAVEENGELHVAYEHRSAVHDLAADVVLMAVGRGPRLDTLNLEEAGIAFTPKGISVNDDLETNVEGVYAVGDINGRCQLAHAATAQSYRALEHLLGEPHRVNADVIPAAVFTHPEAATVGLTEEAAKAAYGEAQVHKAYYRANGRALTMDADTDGLLKIVTTAAGRIVGAHLLGDHASELIHELSVVMSQGGHLDDIRCSIHAHPTLSEIVAQAAAE